MKNNKVNISSLFVPLLILVGCNSLPLYPISDIEEEFDGIREIVVNGGALEISYNGGSESDKVYLNAFVEANDETKEGVTYKRSGDQLIVDFETDFDMSFFFGNRVKGFISLTGPEDMALNMTSSSGKMEVSKVKNKQVSLKINSGKMEGKNIHSPNLKVRASSGMVSLERIEGHLDLQISSGMASLDGMKGDVLFKGSSGVVNIYRVEGMVSGKMSSGKAKLQKVSNLGEITLSSGMLEAEDCGLGENTYLGTSSGYMTVTSSTGLREFNYDFTVGSGSLTIGDRSSSENLYIDNGAPTTIKGKLQSGKLDLKQL